MATSKKSEQEPEKAKAVDLGGEIQHGLDVSPTMPYYCTWLPGACPAEDANLPTIPPLTVPPMCPPAGAGAATIVPTIVPPCPTLPQVCVVTYNPPCPKPISEDETAQTKTIITCTGIPYICGPNAGAQNVSVVPNCPSVAPMCPNTAFPVCPIIGPTGYHTCIQPVTSPVATCIPQGGSPQAITIIPPLCPMTNPLLCPPSVGCQQGAVAQNQTILPTTTVSTAPTCPPHIQTVVGCGFTIPHICTTQAQPAVQTLPQTGMIWCPSLLPMCPQTALCTGTGPAQAQTISLPPHGCPNTLLPACLPANAAVTGPPTLPTHWIYCQAAPQADPVQCNTRANCANTLATVCTQTGCSLMPIQPGTGISACFCATTQEGGFQAPPVQCHTRANCANTLATVCTQTGCSLLPIQPAVAPSVQVCATTQQGPWTQPNICHTAGPVCGASVIVINCPTGVPELCNTLPPTQKCPVAGTQAQVGTLHTTNTLATVCTLLPACHQAGAQQAQAQGITGFICSIIPMYCAVTAIAGC